MSFESWMSNRSMLTVEEPHSFRNELEGVRSVEDSVVELILVWDGQYGCIIVVCSWSRKRTCR